MRKRERERENVIGGWGPKATTTTTTAHPKTIEANHRIRTQRHTPKPRAHGYTALPNPANPHTRKDKERGRTQRSSVTGEHLPAGCGQHSTGRVAAAPKSWIRNTSTAVSLGPLPSPWNAHMTGEPDLRALVLGRHDSSRSHGPGHANRRDGYLPTMGVTSSMLLGVV